MLYHSFSESFKGKSHTVLIAMACSQEWWQLSSDSNAGYSYGVAWIFFFLHWHYSPLWALSCRTISFNFFLSVTSSLHLLIPSTWRSLSTSSFHPFLGLHLRLVPSRSWVKIFFGILSSSILSRWANQLILWSCMNTMGKTTTGCGYLPTCYSYWLPNNRNSLLHSTVHTSYCDTLHTRGHIDLPSVAQYTNILTHL